MKFPQVTYGKLKYVRI